MSGRVLAVIFHANPKFFRSLMLYPIFLIWSKRRLRKE